jgi:hypothetical protein
MSSNKLSSGEGVTITRDHWDVPLRVRLRAYLRFSRQIDKQLHRLVVHWSHAASPYARGVCAPEVVTNRSYPRNPK